MKYKNIHEQVYCVFVNDSFVQMILNIDHIKNLCFFRVSLSYVYVNGPYEQRSSNIDHIEIFWYVCVLFSCAFVNVTIVRTILSIDHIEYLWCLHGYLTFVCRFIITSRTCLVFDIDFPSTLTTLHSNGLSGWTAFMCRTRCHLEGNLTSQCALFTKKIFYSMMYFGFHFHSITTSCFTWKVDLFPTTRIRPHNGQEFKVSDSRPKHQFASKGILLHFTLTRTGILD